MRRVVVGRHEGAPVERERAQAGRGDGHDEWDIVTGKLGPGEGLDDKEAPFVRGAGPGRDGVVKGECGFGLAVDGDGDAGGGWRGGEAERGAPVGGVRAQALAEAPVDNFGDGCAAQGREGGDDGPGVAGGVRGRSGAAAADGEGGEARGGGGEGGGREGAERAGGGVGAGVQGERVEAEGAQGGGEGAEVGGVAQGDGEVAQRGRGGEEGEQGRVGREGEAGEVGGGEEAGEGGRGEGERGVQGEVAQGGGEDGGPAERVLQAAGDDEGVGEAGQDGVAQGRGGLGQVQEGVERVAVVARRREAGQDELLQLGRQGVQDQVRRVRRHCAGGGGGEGAGAGAGRGRGGADDGGL